MPRKASLDKYPALKKLREYLPWTIEIVGVTRDEKHFLITVDGRGPVCMGFGDKHLNKASFKDVLRILLYYLSKRVLVLYQEPEKTPEKRGRKRKAKARTPQGETKKQL